jgi:hypothetical protein
MIALRKTSLLSFRIKNIQVKSRQNGDKDNFLYLLSSEPSHKAGMLVMRRDFKWIMKIQLKNGEPSLRTLDEGFFTLSYSMMFTRNLPYTETFLKRVNQMISSGYIQRADNARTKDHVPERKNEKIPPQVLTLEQLAIGFTVYLIACGLCVLVFIIEYIFSFFTC